ncbi:unnamed protein product [Parajaminaea phylloscopi]
MTADVASTIETATTIPSSDEKDGFESADTAAVAGLPRVLRLALATIFCVLTVASLVVATVSTVWVSRWNSPRLFEEMHLIIWSGVLTQVGLNCFAGWWTFTFAAVNATCLVCLRRAALLSSVASHGLWLLLTNMFWIICAALITSSLGTVCGNERNTALCGSCVVVVLGSWTAWLCSASLLIGAILIGRSSAFAFRS